MTIPATGLPHWLLPMLYNLLALYQLSRVPKKPLLKVTHIYWQNDSVLPKMHQDLLDDEMLTQKIQVFNRHILLFCLPEVQFDVCVLVSRQQFWIFSKDEFIACLLQLDRNLHKKQSTLTDSGLLFCLNNFLTFQVQTSLEISFALPKG